MLLFGGQAYFGIKPYHHIENKDEVWLMLTTCKLPEHVDISNMSLPN